MPRAQCQRVAESVRRSLPRLGERALGPLREPVDVNEIARHAADDVFRGRIGGRDRIQRSRLRAQRDDQSSAVMPGVARSTSTSSPAQPQRRGRWRGSDRMCTERQGAAGSTRRIDPRALVHERRERVIGECDRDQCDGRRQHPPVRRQHVILLKGAEHAAPARRSARRCRDRGTRARPRRADTAESARWPA